MEGEWREVRRKWREETDKPGVEEITYFVTNVSKEARKGELRNTFSRFGKLTDVYMGNKAGRNGQYYVFIRFTGVKDIKELEEKLDGTLYRGKRLSVNLAKHRRKEPPSLKNTGEDNYARQLKRDTKPNYSMANGFRDNRTFAEALRPNLQNAVESGVVKQPQHLPPPPPLLQKMLPIRFVREQGTHNWLRKTTLAGKTVSLNHLGHLPKILLAKKGTSLEIKYLGGLNVLLEFGSSKEAKEFMEDGKRWQEHLCWLEWGEKAHIEMDRVFE
ncbi:hypothetical protein LXL04_038596 [Taraxacum kok-saghyz]